MLLFLNSRGVCYSSYYHRHHLCTNKELILFTYRNDLKSWKPETKRPNIDCRHNSMINTRIWNHQYHQLFSFLKEGTIFAFTETFSLTWQPKGQRANITAQSLATECSLEASADVRRSSVEWRLPRGYFCRIEHLRGCPQTKILVDGEFLAYMLSSWGTKSGGCTS